MLQKLFHENWQSIFYLLNLFFLIITLLFFFKLADFINNSIKLNFFIILLLFASLDFFIWPHFLLTEVLFILFLSSFLFFYTRKILFKDILLKRYILLCASIFVLALFSKPGSLGVLLGIVFFHILQFLNFAQDERRLKFSILFIIILSPVLYQIFISSIDEIDSFKVSQLLGYVQEGVIIHDRESTYINSAESSAAKVFLLRFVYFFIPIVPEMSLIHKLADSLFAILLLFSILIWSLYSEFYSFRHKVLCQLMLLIFIFSGLYHSATLIDFDWRYRFTSIIPMLLFISYNLSEVFYNSHDRSNNSSIQNKNQHRECPS